MEILILLLVILAAVAILVAAWRGAEAAEREREQRWSQLSELPAAGNLAARPAPAAGPRTANAGPRGASVATAAASAGVATAPSQGRSPQPGVGAPPARLAGRPPGQAAGRPLSPTAGPPQPASSPGQRVAKPAPASRPATPDRRPPRPEPEAIDVNTAPVGDLQKLPGVGIRAAERIVAHRERHGSFASVADLEAVDGFDQHRVARLAPRARV